MGFIAVSQLVPYLISFIVFLVGGLISIGIWYLRELDSSIKELAAKSAEKRQEFYDKYEELCDENAELKTLISNIMVEHKLMCRKGE